MSLYTIVYDTWQDKMHTIPYYHPGTFSGTKVEPIDGFYRTFERLPKINSWVEEECKLYVPLFFGNTPVIVFEHLGRRNTHLSWREIKLELPSICWESRDILVVKLHSEFQLPNGGTVSYVAEIANLCNLCDIVQEEQVWVHILKGLNAVSNVFIVSLLYNCTLNKVKEYVRQVEMTLFFVSQRLSLPATPLDVNRLTEIEVDRKWVDIEHAEGGF